MRTLRAAVVAGLLLAAAPVAAGGETLFEFEQFAGIPTPGLTIRGIPGGGLPWSVRKGEARLSADGALKVEVEGLVFAAGPNVGRNTVPMFAATLSCLDAAGQPVNLTTPAVPATVPGGDATVEVDFDLPETCLAPLVFVGTAASAQFPNGRWFAVSGF